MNNSNNRVLIGIVVLLAAINIAILVTIGFNYARRDNDFRPEIKADTPRELQHTRFLTRELNLTPEQQEEFESLREEYTKAVRDVRMEIRSTYQRSIIELASDTPNENILDSLSNEIALLHKKHHQITINHFKSVKGVCNESQQECLHKMFFRMMPMDENRDIRSQRMHAPHRGRGPRDRANTNNN